MEEQLHKINLNYLRPNCRIIYPLYSIDGKKILDERTVLTYEKISEIKRRFGIHVLCRELPAVSAISPERMETALELSRDIMGEVMASEKITQSAYRGAEHIVEEIVTDLHSSEVEAIALLKNLKTYDSYIYQHSVNVGVLAAVFAKMLGVFDREQIKFLSLGAYLLDIGIMRIDRKLINKSERYNRFDFQKVKQHPQYGYEMLKSIPGIDPIVLQTLLFHHERNNYRGYFQLPYDLLPMPPKIVSICDMYDALTSPRPYREAVSPTGTLRFLVNSINTYFDYELVSNFINKVAPLLNNAQTFYSRGDFCELNTQELGLITDFSPNDYMKPKMLVFCKFEVVKERMSVMFYKNPFEIELERDDRRYLTKIIDNRRLINTIKSKLIEKGILPYYPESSSSQLRNTV